MHGQFLKAYGRKFQRVPDSETAEWHVVITAIRHAEELSFNGYTIFSDSLLVVKSIHGEIECSINAQNLLSELMCLIWHRPNVFI